MTDENEILIEIKQDQCSDIATALQVIAKFGNKDSFAIKKILQTEFEKLEKEIDELTKQKSY